MSQIFTPEIVYRKAALVLIPTNIERTIYTAVNKTLYTSYDFSWVKTVAPFDDPSFDPSIAGRFVRPYPNNIITELKWLCDIETKSSEPTFYFLLGSDKSIETYIYDAFNRMITCTQSIIYLFTDTPHSFDSDVWRLDLTTWVSQKIAAHSITKQKQSQDKVKGYQKQKAMNVINIVIPTAKLPNVFEGIVDVTWASLAKTPGIQVFSTMQLTSQILDPSSVILTAKHQVPATSL